MFDVKTKEIVEQKEEPVQKEDNPSEENKTETIDQKDLGNDETKDIEKKAELNTGEVCMKTCSEAMCSNNVLRILRLKARDLNVLLI